MRSLGLFVIKLYQKFITLLSYGSCRYYPTCSQYAKEQLLFNNFFKAIFLSIIRILKCNQLFAGGIDYPIVSKVFDSHLLFRKQTSMSQRIVYWFVPKSAQSFYVVKAFQ